VPTHRLNEEQASELGQKIARRLAADARFERLRDDHELDVQRYCNLDLASLIELRFAEQVDPDALVGALRESWIERAVDESESVDRPFVLDRLCYWVRSPSGERIGSIACRVEPFTLRPTVALSSVFISPAHRSRGIGQCVLLAMRDAAYAEGIQNVTLHTEWLWQRSVRFYTRAGMWLRSWKDDLQFVFGVDLPRWRADFDGSLARFSVEEAGAWRALIEAEHKGERLGWTETDELKRHPRLQWEAPTTFALMLATHGWPLKRNDDWRKHWASDAVHPEAFARRIQGFESWARKNGWRVDTPRIPDLEYPAWRALNSTRG
jgi:GNAT superfamily N-acetyltransferase